MAEKRKRGQNFTAEEKAKLVELLLEHKDVISNKKTNGTTNDAKNNAWLQVTNAFNASGCSNVYRSKQSLLKVWEKLKGEGKLYYNCAKNSTQTVGATVIKIDPILKQVLKFFEHGSIDINDSDADYDEETEEKCLPKIFCIPETLEVEVEDNNITPSIDEHTDTSEENGRIPLSYRKLQAPSQTNDRAEHMTVFCDRYKVKNKKENMDELRLQLLQEEIDFKRKYYDLRLQAAAKEVKVKEKDLEIREEVLRQIKGGGISLHNLIGVTEKKD